MVITGEERSTAVGMEGTVEAMAAAYEALLDAAAAAVRSPTSDALTHLNVCLHAFAASCDRADDLVQAAAAHLAVPVPSPPDTPRLCHALHPTVQAPATADLHGDVDPAPSPSPSPSPPVVQEQDK